MATPYEIETAASAGAAPRARWKVALREFMRSPSLVGSAFPASRYLIDALLAPMDWASIGLVVEYGPGTGPITRAALKRMRADSRLLAIDVSEGFTDYLQTSIADERLIAVRASAECVNALLAAFGLGQADMIVTGLPFSTLDSGTADLIADASVSALKDDGCFLAYQMRRSIEPILESRFGRVRSTREWRNIPPCHLYWASKALSARRLGPI